MSREHEKYILRAGVEQSGITLTEKQADQFLDYYDLLVEWNKKINLTAITDFEQVVFKHFADSTSLLSVLNLPHQSSLIDVGTGAGFPGIPLKIARPDLHITLCDSLNKRVGFLNEVIKSLKLDSEGGSIQAIHARAEELARDLSYRGSFDYAVSRAVSNISVISEYCVPFLKVDGIFAAYKSTGLSAEMQEFGGGLDKLNAALLDIKEFQMKGAGETADRAFALVRKTDVTPEQYPRRSGIPEKRPLK